jgi:tRNA(adenine34) deaminase
MTHDDWMQLALKQAQIAEQIREVPIGAILVIDGKCIASSYNQTIFHKDPTAHAEIQCIRAACKTSGNHRLANATLYVTLEPCIMCYGAIIQSRVGLVVFGALDPKSGVFSQTKLSKLLNLNHHPSHIGGVLENTSSKLLQAFFKSRRES